MNCFLLKIQKIKTKYFKKILDITLFKLVNKQDNEFCVIDEFDSIVKGFDEKDINKR